MLESSNSPHLPLFVVGNIGLQVNLTRENRSVAFSYLEIKKPNIKSGKKSRNGNTGSIYCLKQLESSLKTLLISVHLTCKLLGGQLQQ